nr:hypothetical protein Iba_scaffold54911CG0010 [Ipomoea batatas]GME07712.1 hypothetical protein Iba_scaffold6462CG0230 [Ipomoea batatas]
MCAEVRSQDSDGRNNQAISGGVDGCGCGGGGSDGEGFCSADGNGLGSATAAIGDGKGFGSVLLSATVDDNGEKLCCGGTTVFIASV